MLDFGAGFKRYLGNTSWLLAQRVIQIGAGLVMTAAIARYLSPDGFGLLGYAQSFVGLFALAATLGLDNAVVRDLVSQPERRNELLGTAIILRLIGFVCVMVTLYCGVKIFVSDQRSQTMILIIGSSLLFQAVNVVDLFFQARVLSRYSAVASLLATGVNVLSTVAMIASEVSVDRFAYLAVITNAISSFFLYLFYRQHGMSPMAWRYDHLLAKTLIAESWPVLLSIILVSGYVNLDRIMIMHYLGPVATGEYNAAAKLSEGWYFLPVVIVASLVPPLVNARIRSADLYRERLQNMYTLLVWIAIPVAASVSLLVTPLISALYGDSYRSAATVLSVHIWTGVFVFLGVASGRWMLIEGLTRSYLYRYILGITINVALNALLIPSEGIIGAAYAALVAQVFVVFVYDLIDPKAHPSLLMKCRALLPLYLLKRNHKPNVEHQEIS